MRRLFALLVLSAVAGMGCLSSVGVKVPKPAGPIGQPATFDHAAFTAILRGVVDEDGYVDYAALKERPAALDAYVARLAQTDPVNLPDADRLAFWLNAYNAYTLYLVRERYPVGSILGTDTGPFIPGVNSPFSAKFAVIGGERVSLDDIEHGTIREEFDEPRIHFALVCAAVSCPPLRDEAYRGDVLDEQLDEQGRRFLQNPHKNQVDLREGEVVLSKIFDWFEGDFGGSPDDVQRYLAPYAATEAEREALAAARLDVEYADYDWSLNDQDDR
jgi:hypothetical protein